MTAVTPPAPADGPSLEHRLALRADLSGLIGLMGPGVLLVAVGAGWVTGPLAALALVLLLGVMRR